MRLHSIIAVTLAILGIACTSGWAQGLGDAVGAASGAGSAVTRDGGITPGGGTAAGSGAAASATPAVANEWAMRNRIVELAAGEVGLVDERAGDDGFKKGWQRLKLFYEVAYGYADLERDQPNWLPQLKAPEARIASGPAHWCGIFGVWAWRTAGMQVSWNTCVSTAAKKRIEPYYFPDTTKYLNVGDIVVIKEKEPKTEEEKKKFKPLNHHCVVEWRNGDEFGSINGNSDFQQVKRITRKVNTVACVYSVAKIMGLKPRAYADNPNPGMASGTPGPGLIASGSGASDGSGSATGSTNPLAIPNPFVDAVAEFLDGIVPGLGDAVRAGLIRP